MDMYNRKIDMYNRKINMYNRKKDMCNRKKPMCNRRIDTSLSRKKCTIGRLPWSEFTRAALGPPLASPRSMGQIWPRLGPRTRSGKFPPFWPQSCSSWFNQGPSPLPRGIEIEKKRERGGGRGDRLKRK